MPKKYRSDAFAAIHPVCGKPRGLARGRERGHRRCPNWPIFGYEYQTKMKGKYTMPSVA